MVYRVTSSRLAGAERRSDVGGTLIAEGTYDDQDRLASYGLPPSPATYTYTPNGELAAKTDAAGTTTYEYGPLGNLRRVVLPGGGAVDYLVDAEGRRTGKKLDGTLTQGFLYDGQLRVVAELDGSNQVVSRFVYGTQVNVPELMIKSGVAYRIVTNQLGSVRLVVNTADGSIAQRIDYDEFGVVTQDTSPGFQPFGFAGGLYDRDVGAVRFGARDYFPSLGRWTSKEPLRFSGDRNFYLYAQGDPVNLADPAGLAAFFNWSLLPIPYKPEEEDGAKLVPAYWPLPVNVDAAYSPSGVTNPLAVKIPDNAVAFLLPNGQLWVFAAPGFGAAGTPKALSPEDLQKGGPQWGFPNPYDPNDPKWPFPAWPLPGSTPQEASPCDEWPWLRG